jgi:hypothetical protein
MTTTAQQQVPCSLFENSYEDEEATPDNATLHSDPLRFFQSVNYDDIHYRLCILLHTRLSGPQPHSNSSPNNNINDLLASN